MLKRIQDVFTYREAEALLVQAGYEKTGTFSRTGFNGKLSQFVKGAGPEQQVRHIFAHDPKSKTAACLVLQTVDINALVEEGLVLAQKESNYK